MNYNEFSSEFNATRQNLWPELLEFEKYIKDGQKILDLGCGNGRLVNLLKNYDIQYVGSDISSDLLNYAKKQDFGKIKNFQFIESDMLDLELPDDNFDIIFLIASYHHLRTKLQRIEILLKMKKWLKKDGLIIMTNWNLFQKKYIKYIFNPEKQSWNDFLIPWKDKKGSVVANRFYHGFMLKELKKLAKNHGFNVLKNAYSNSKRNIITILSKN
ncbi:MAG TPA: methyltransferase domain-containing protein [bacterium]|jgi:tRNA (uracil-5-)-methyltransferase TRM9|nr:methyltransferase domain-containing protein [bacterium]HOG37990.1 methyltransferase domain-containing protein [bacterium]HQI03049.1 methyltransferase domain-containing protein [bacterium]